MTGLIAALLPLVTEALRFINTKASRKYIDELASLKQDLNEEQSKGFESDDEKVVQIYKRMKIVAEAAHQEWLSNVSKGGQ